ncbi:DNA polymerase IV [Amycolatopsis suaedae]|uniref:DNA-directed DNA polymerase n=1 Tax=Amycolatopsis suaedae TaxID=2510978 RepID=A0A4Q7JDB1_9PSEU|nr:DNA polymerase IV [Amycolatopsis suaedae]RZQ65880.1 DNA polymerase IV [Amycolatopsis suaedae]
MGEPAESWILHVDLDQFVAAVEILRRPELRGRPVVVGGSADPTRRRVVVATASYEARAHGVRSGMPLRTAARLCPDAVFLETDHAACEAASARVMDTLRTFGPVEVIGWDEAFLGVGADPARRAAEVRAAVPARTGLTCAVGIGDNKHRAKLATGFAKQGDGVFLLTETNWWQVMGGRPVTALWGIGPRMADNLAALGIETVDDLAAADPAVLTTRFGPNMGPHYLGLGHGHGGTALVTEPRVAKSRGSERTFPADLTDPAEVAAQVRALARERATEAAAAGRTVARVEVTLRFAPYFTKTRSRTLPGPTTDAGTVERAALDVLGRFAVDRPVRLIGVRVVFTDP